jgi:hypothetical protein
MAMAFKYGGGLFINQIPMLSSIRG